MTGRLARFNGRQAQICTARIHDTACTHVRFAMVSMILRRCSVGFVECYISDRHYILEPFAVLVIMAYEFAANGLLPIFGWGVRVLGASPAAG